MYRHTKLELANVFSHFLLPLPSFFLSHRHGNPLYLLPFFILFLLLHFIFLFPSSFTSPFLIIRTHGLMLARNSCLYLSFILLPFSFSFLVAILCLLSSISRFFFFFPSSSNYLNLFHLLIITYILICANYIYIYITCAIIL